jgi:hypothetical protein
MIIDAGYRKSTTLPYRSDMIANSWSTNIICHADSLRLPIRSTVSRKIKLHHRPRDYSKSVTECATHYYRMALPSFPAAELRTSREKSGINAYISQTFGSQTMTWYQWDSTRFRTVFLPLSRLVILTRRGDGDLRTHHRIASRRGINRSR